jgi:hypothetical protein
LKDREEYLRILKELGMSANNGGNQGGNQGMPDMSFMEKLGPIMEAKKD